MIENYVVVILTYLAFSSAWNTNMKYSQLFVSHLKVLVSFLHCLFLLLSWMIIVTSVLGSEVNCRGEPRNWLRFFLLRNSHLLPIIAHHSTLYGIVKQSKRDRWISEESVHICIFDPRSFLLLGWCWFLNFYVSAAFHFCSSFSQTQ